MKKYIVPIMLIASPLSAGGLSGGGGAPALQVDTQALMTPLDSLPKGYADSEELRRASIRLGESGIETTALTVDGEIIKVRKLRDSIVNDEVSKEILPQ